MLKLAEMTRPPDHELPRLDATVLALAYMAVALERDRPGFLDDWQRIAEDPTVHAEIRALREPPITHELTDALHGAQVLVRHTRLVALAWMEERRRRKKRHED